MSSFDPLRRPSAAGPAFAPLSATSMDPVLARANVFRAFDAAPAASVETDEPAAAAKATAAAAESQAAQSAYAAAYAAGHAAALQEGIASAKDIAGAVEELTRFRASLIERYERELLELALGVARKVVQRELAEHPEHWMGMLREGVRMALDRETIRIRVGSILHRFLLEHLPELRAQLEDVKELELVEDASIGETGCVVESRYGELELGIDGQIDAIRATLMSAE